VVRRGSGPARRKHGTPRHETATEAAEAEAAEAEAAEAAGAGRKAANANWTVLFRRFGVHRFGIESVSESNRARPPLRKPLAGQAAALMASASSFAA
jgi:hypothetical protein